MKVLMFGWEFPPFNSGGLGTACQGLTKSLAKQNVEVIFVLPRKVDLKVDFLKLVYGDADGIKIKKEYYVNSPLQAYSTEESYGCNLSKEKIKNKKNYGSNLMEEVKRYGAVGGQIAEKENFDVIHAHDWLTYEAGIAAKKAIGKPLFVHVHSTEFDRTGGNGVNQEVYEIEKKGMQEADLVIAISNLTRNRVIESYGISPDKVKTVHNGVDFDEYISKEMHNLSQSKKIVLFIGRLTLQKGPDYFIAAAKKALEFYPDVMFIVAGSGDMERAMIRKVAELGISDKFVFTGWLKGKEVYDAYQMADLYVMPSVSEPFGLIPLESMKCGTPVIISNQTGVSEVLTHCLKTDFWDTDEMANKIVSVLKYGELHKTLKENGSKEVDKINWDEPAKRCIDIYNKILKENK